MKRSLAIILALVLAVSAMSACSININFGGKNENPTEKNVDSDIELPTVEIPTVPELPTEVEVGKLEDYVGTAKEKELSFGRVYTELPTLNDVFLEITGKALRDKEE